MKIVIIGGAGFIGINSAYFFSSKGHQVIIIDNLSRVGSEYNLRQYQQNFNGDFYHVDIRDFSLLKRTLKKLGKIDAILLLAGQVAVTTSVSDPREDFEINAMGTFNVLDALRLNKQTPLVIYSSTNKVYGKMEDEPVVLNNTRYEYTNAKQGISEARQLDFYSPYGCSKGAGDQYVHDFSRIFDLPTVVFRQSCIYGVRQFGIEDQGWVAWFTIATLLRKKFSIYGDGNQVRDVLYCDDLMRLYELAIENPNTCRGKIYNVGGGNELTLSLNELIAMLEKKFNTKMRPERCDWRPGDQRVYVSDISKVKTELNWQPEVSVSAGIDKMASWIEENEDILSFYTAKKI